MTIRKYAILIGIDEYADTTVRRLECAQHDVLRMAHTLGELCGFETVELHGRNATAASVVDAFGALSGRVAPEDLFLFFFAGHGYNHSAKGHLLLMHDTRRLSLKKMPTGVMPVRELQGLLDDLPCRRQVLMLDACRTDLDATRAATAASLEGGSARDIAALAVRKAARDCRVICSCSPGEEALEIPSLRAGAFTRAFTNVIRTRTHQGEEVSVDRSLLTAVNCELEALLNEHGYTDRSQHPWMEGADTQLVLAQGHKVAPPRSSGRILLLDPPCLHITTQPSGAAVSVDGRGQGGSPVRVELAGGTHNVRVEKAGYRTWARRIDFDGQGDAELPVTLEALPKGPQVGDERTFAGIEMVWIPPGEFMMGGDQSPEEVARSVGSAVDWYKTEHPRHRVVVSRGFWLGKYAVTQSQWEAVMGNNPSRFKGDGRLPVEEVSWDDCQSFIRKLKQQGAGTFRLPTEAEWEYACRAGTTTPFCFGATISTEQGNYDGNYTYGNGKKGVYRAKTTTVGSFPANAWGLYDMHGNVWEWCEDDWHDAYAGAPTDGRAWVDSPRGSDRVLRGGSWCPAPWNCRSAYRGRLTPENRSYYLGFRLALPAVQ